MVSFCFLTVVSPPPFSPAPPPAPHLSQFSSPSLFPGGRCSQTRQPLYKPALLLARRCTFWAEGHRCVVDDTQPREVPTRMAVLLLYLLLFPSPNLSLDTVAALGSCTGWLLLWVGQGKVEPHWIISKWCTDPSLSLRSVRTAICFERPFGRSLCAVRLLSW